GEFIAVAGRAPGEVLLEVPETRRAVTIALAAINAVMAGCEPESFPVIVAALEGWADTRWGIGDRSYFYLSTTGDGGQLLVVNGPLRHELDDVTIARALRLILINALGLPAGDVSCIAENEEASPWEPLPVERGCAASAVAVFSGYAPERVDNHLSGT